MNETLKRIGALKVVPIMTFDKADDADPVAEALVAGGLPIAEVTFRTDAAEESIRRMAARGDLLVGAGTILTTEQADRAIDAGASFILAPGTSPPVVEHCLKRNIPITPGIATPTDIELAMSLGLSVLKFFPIELLGGVKMLKAIAAPYNQIQFLPTGGITRDKLLDYLRSNGFKTFICSGGGIDFMRAVSESLYGIPPEQVIGSSGKKVFEEKDGKWSMTRPDKLSFYNDMDDKAVSIDLHIGRRPLIAMGNVRSHGDIGMCAYSQGRKGPSLQLLVNHDDADREFAYAEDDGESLKAAKANGWIIVSVKNDWKTVFAGVKK